MLRIRYNLQEDATFQIKHQAQYSTANLCLGMYAKDVGVPYRQYIQQGVIIIKRCGVSKRGGAPQYAGAGGRS